MPLSGWTGAERTEPTFCSCRASSGADDSGSCELSRDLLSATCGNEGPDPGGPPTSIASTAPNITSCSFRSVSFSCAIAEKGAVAAVAAAAAAHGLACIKPRPEPASPRVTTVPLPAPLPSPAVAAGNEGEVVEASSPAAARVCTIRPAAAVSGSAALAPSLSPSPVLSEPRTACLAGGVGRRSHDSPGLAALAI